MRIFCECKEVQGCLDKEQEPEAGVGGWKGGFKVGGYMDTYGWFTLFNGRNLHNSVKQLSSN